MGTLNFSKTETTDLFDWIMSSEDDREYFRQLVRIWGEKYGATDPAKFPVLEQLTEYATLREPGELQFKFHHFASDYIANANLIEIVDRFFEIWGGPPCRRILAGKRIDGERKIEVEDLSGVELIKGHEVVVTDNYGEELFRFAKDLMRVQGEAVRCLH